MVRFTPAIARRRHHAALRVIAAGCLAATLGGCYTTRQEAMEIPQDYRLRHPITLSNGQQTVEVFLAHSRGGLSPAQRADVLAFAQTWRHEATSGIVIDVPRGSRTKLAAADTLKEIHSILNASGVPGNGVRVRAYEPADLALPSIKISYGRMVAQAGPCGRWPGDLGPTTDKTYITNEPFWNLGCSNQRNLAAQIDNPADLVQPRGESPAYQARRSIAMDKFRKGDNPSGTYPSDASNSYDNSKLSNLGK